MKSFFSILSALIMGLFLVIMIYNCQSIRTALHKNTPKELHAKEVSTSPIEAKTNTNCVELYRIVDKEDFSYRTPDGHIFVLKDYRILLLSNDATSNQIQQIAENIAVAEYNVSAFNVYFFWPGTEKSEAYTAAMATYAPNGRWDDFQKSSPKKLVMRYGRAKAESMPQPRSGFGFKPTSSNRKQIYWDLVNEEDRADMTDGDYERSKRIISKRHGLSVSEVTRIQVEGVDNRWPIPEEPRH